MRIGIAGRRNDRVYSVPVHMDEIRHWVDAHVALARPFVLDAHEVTLAMVEDRPLHHRVIAFGASLLARTICAAAGTEGWRHTYGDRMGPTPVEAERARARFGRVAGEGASLLLNPLGTGLRWGGAAYRQLTGN